MTISVGSIKDTRINMLTCDYTCNCQKLAKANTSSRQNAWKKKKKSGKIKREKERQGGVIVKSISPLIAAGNNTLIGL